MIVAYAIAFLDCYVKGAPESLVLRIKQPGAAVLLETRTMGMLRALLHKRLKAVDRHDRYRLPYPHIPGLDASNPLNVDSKVLVVDDDLCSVGSANFNNRSMRFDTECNIVIDARGEARIRRGIALFRNRLVPEHLGSTPADVASQLPAQAGSLVRTLDAMTRSGRTLKPIEPVLPADADAFVYASALVDPERPVDPEALAAEFVPPDVREAHAATSCENRFVVAAVCPDRRGGEMGPSLDWIPLHALVTAARREADSPSIAVAAFAIYAIGGLIGFPITVLVVTIGIVFGPFLGTIYAFAGTVLHAVVTYSLGRRLGQDTVRRIAGYRLNRITRKLATQRVAAVDAIRLFQIASFSRISVVAGASHLRFRPFLVGTALGIAPWIPLTVAFMDRVGAAINDPGAGNFVLLAVAVAA